MKTSTVLWIAGAGLGGLALYLFLRPGEEEGEPDVVFDPETGEPIAVPATSTRTGTSPANTPSTQPSSQPGTPSGPVCHVNAIIHDLVQYNGDPIREEIYFARLQVENPMCAYYMRAYVDRIRRGGR